MYTTGRFTINGVDSVPPIEAVPKIGENGLFIEASFGVENVQPALTPLEFTFANEGAKQIRDLVADGLIFQGVDFTAEVIGDAGTIEVINGYLDLTDGFQEISPVMVKVNAKFKESTLSLEDQVASISIDLLREEGALTDSDLVDVEYVIEKPINLVEVAVISITLYLMIKELAEATEKVSNDIAVVLGLSSTSVTGTVGATVYQIAIIVVRLAYITIMLRTIILLMNDLLSQFISPVRATKGFTLRSILEVGFEYLGYGFESDLTDLDNLVYTPSIRTKSAESTDTFEAGIPGTNDYGYTFGEIVKISRDYFYAKIAVVNGVIQFRTDSDPYWLKQSTYKMPDVLLDEENPKEYNTADMVKSRTMQFGLDDSDWWTLDNYKGTSYTVITQHTNAVDSQKDGLKGYEYLSFPVALGNVKENLNALEIILQVLAKSADVITGVFGGRQNFAERIERRVGMLKISHENTSKPKLLYMQGSTIPQNHRELLSAKVGWEDYQYRKSMVADNFYRQRVFYTGVTFGFGLSGFLQLINNSYFYTNAGKIGKFTNIKWDWQSDQVIADFWIQHVYTDKLKELKIEQQG
jgi:hypothetical protein